MATYLGLTDLISVVNVAWTIDNKDFFLFIEDVEKKFNGFTIIMFVLFLAVHYGL